MVNKIGLDRYISLEDLKNEEWRDVSEYKGYYLISNYGRVKRLPYSVIHRNKDGSLSRIFYNERILKGSICRNGYVRVTLTKNSKNRYYYVHSLVANAFLSNNENLPCINHKNEIKSDNRVCNIEWCTYQYNNTYNNLAETRKVKGKNAKIKIKLFNKNGNFIMLFNSQFEAANYLKTSNSYVLRSAKHHRTCKGYYVERVQ